MGRSLPSVAAVLLLGALGACAHENDTDHDRAAEPSPSYSVVPVPPKPLTGTLDAVLRQSSRDAARGRMQVWIFNGTRADVEPRRITYDDGRLDRPIAAQRVRTIPSGLERGFPLPLVDPRCPAEPGGPPVLVVETGAGTERVPVADSIGIVQRYVDAGCFEQAVRRVVDLRWSDEVSARDGTGTMTLVGRPTGAAGRVELVGVGATPVLKAPRTTTWRVRRTIAGDGPVRRLRLPVMPARCDSHAFFEAGGATAFRLRLRLPATGDVGEFVLRMSPAGARSAIAYAIDACGLDD